MKKNRILVFAFLPWLLVRAMTFADGPVPEDVAENARQQNADKAFSEAEKALTVRLLDKASAWADEDARLLGEVKVANKSLSDHLSSLRASDEGKKLASVLDDISAEEVQRLFDEPSVTTASLSVKEQELGSATAELEKFRSDPPAGFVLPDEEQDELSQLSARFRQMLAHIKERDAWLTSLISSAPKDLNLSAASTLAAVLAEFRLRQQKDWNEAQRSGIESAKPEALARITESARTAELEKSLAQANAMLEETRSEIELSKFNRDMQLKLLREEKDSELAKVNQKLAESEAHRDVVNAEADATRGKGAAEAEDIRLRQKCEDPEVKRRLAPFIAKGLWQPGDRPGAPWLGDSCPISLSALRKCGALEPTERGLTRFYICGNGRYINWPYQRHPDMERPKWGFPGAPSLLSQDDWQQLRRNQELLNELGDTMVSLGMLSP